MSSIFIRMNPLIVSSSRVCTCSLPSYGYRSKGMLQSVPSSIEVDGSCQDNESSHRSFWLKAGPTPQPTTQISSLFLRRPSSKVELLAVQHGAKAWLAIPPPHQHMRTTQARHQICSSASHRKSFTDICHHCFWARVLVILEASCSHSHRDLQQFENVIRRDDVQPWRVDYA